MAQEALYLRWRSKTFADVVGQGHVTQTIQRASLSGRLAHAYLFSGPRGTGKTSVARILAKTVNCLAEPEQRPCNQCESCVAINQGRYLDLIEIDGASNRGIDEIRELREQVNFRPNHPGGRKVYIIDEVHMLTREAFNALLKTLEEPPEYVIFIFATTEVWRVPPTIRSRCQQFEFRPLRADLIEGRLREICAAEGFTCQPEALAVIARQATGAMRDAISMLDQMASVGGGEITVPLLHEVLGMAPHDAAEELLGYAVAGELRPALELLGRLSSQGVDMEQFGRDLLEMARSLLLVGLGVMPSGGLTQEQMSRLRELAASTSLERTRRITEEFAQALSQPRSGYLPQLPLELAVVAVSQTPEMTTSSPAAEVTPPTRVAEPSSPPMREPAEPRQAAPPPEVPVRVSESSRSGPTEPLTLERTKRLWLKVWAKALPRDRTLEALLRSTEPSRLEEGRLEVRCLYPYHRAALSRPESLALLRSVVEEVTGMALELDLVMASQSSDGNGQAAVATALQNALEADPLYRAAKELGGTIRVIDRGGT